MNLRHQCSSPRFPSADIEVTNLRISFDTGSCYYNSQAFGQKGHLNFLPQTRSQQYWRSTVLRIPLLSNAGISASERQNASVSLYRSRQASPRWASLQIAGIRVKPNAEPQCSPVSAFHCFGRMSSRFSTGPFWVTHACAANPSQATAEREPLRLQISSRAFQPSGRFWWRKHHW